MSEYVAAPRQGAVRLLHALQWARNGRYPDALFQQRMTEQLNHLALWRCKQLFSFSTWTNAVPAATAGTRSRWRAYVHTSPFARFLAVQMVCAPATNTAATSPGVRCTVEVAPLTFEYGEYRHGASLSAVDTPESFGYGTTLVGSAAAYEITPQTDYKIGFSDQDRGRLVSGTVYEWTLDPTRENGYLRTGFANGTAIYDEDRDDAVRMARDLWKRGAGPLWNWSSDTDATAPTRTSSVAINLLDNSSTAVSAATPGATLDLTYRTTQSRNSTGVPCVFAVHGSVMLGTTGTVELKDSTGAVVATCTGFTTTAGWVTTTCNLPATSAKYDVHFYSNGATTLTVHAFCLYQYLA